MEVPEDKNAKSGIKEQKNNEYTTRNSEGSNPAIDVFRIKGNLHNIQPRECISGERCRPNEILLV